MEDHIAAEVRHHRREEPALPVEPTEGHAQQAIAEQRKSNHDAVPPKEEDGLRQVVGAEDEGAEENRQHDHERTRVASREREPEPYDPRPAGPRLPGGDTGAGAGGHGAAGAVGGKRGRDASLVPLTAPEVRRLLLILALPPEAQCFRLRWSRWRRRRQADAQRCHYRSRQRAGPGQMPVVVLR